MESIKVTEETKSLIFTLWKAMKNRRVVKFDFESNDGNAGIREIRPYMVCLHSGKLKVVGLPRELWKVPPDDKQARHYLLEKIDLRVLELLSETFDDPLVPRDIVVYTKEAEVVCRFIYDDEDEKEVKKSWLKIKGLKL